MTQFTLNGRAVTLDADPDMPLLWALRDVLGFTGTKYGCGIAACGACTVHVDGDPVRSCSFPLSAAEGRRIVTIEGLSPDRSHPLQRAWIDEQVPQCGYCQSGQIMQAAALLAKNPHPTEQQIVNGMTDNLCRCATYSRIVGAVQRAAEIMNNGGRHA